MGPDELFGNDAFGYRAKFIEEWTLLEVNIQTVTEANIGLAYKRTLIDSEWIFDLASAVLEAGERGLADFLCESQ